MLLRRGRSMVGEGHNGRRPARRVKRHCSALLRRGQRGVCGSNTAFPEPLIRTYVSAVRGGGANAALDGVESGQPLSQVADDRLYLGSLGQATRPPGPQAAILQARLALQGGGGTRNTSSPLLPNQAAKCSA